MDAMEDQRLSTAKWSIHNQSEEADFEHSEKTRNVRFLYSPVEANARLGLNKYYSAQLLNCKQIAFFLSIGEKELKEELQKNKIFPAFYRKRSALFHIKDILKLARRLKREFVIPIGFFDTPYYLYIGKEVQELSKIWHEHKAKRYTSIFEMIMEEGIPVQNIIIAPSQIQYLEPSFLTVAGKLFSAYNKTAEKLGNPSKHIYLCSTPGKRECADKLVKQYNKKHNSFLVSIDLDHLITLRGRFAEIKRSK